MNNYKHLSSRKAGHKCRNCDNPVNKRDLAYCSPECKAAKTAFNAEKRRLNNIRTVTDYRHSLKQRAVTYKGGSCKLCGYNRCVNALSFHHINPNNKDFIIADLSKSWERIRQELDKCVLLCENCHREVHCGYINTPGVLS